MASYIAEGHGVITIQGADNSCTAYATGPSPLGTEQATLEKKSLTHAQQSKLERTLKTAIEQGSGIFQFVSPAAHHGYASRDYPIAQYFSQRAVGDLIRIGSHNYQFKGLETLDHLLTDSDGRLCRQFKLHLSLDGEAKSIVLTQVGMSYKNQFFNESELAQVHHFYDHHLKQLTRHAHGIGHRLPVPVIHSFGGIGRNATLICMLEALRRGPSSDASSTHKTLQSIIDSSRRALGTDAFFHNPKQLEYLVNYLSRISSHHPDSPPSAIDNNKRRYLESSSQTNPEQISLLAQIERLSRQTCEKVTKPLLLEKLTQFERQFGMSQMHPSIIDQLPAYAREYIGQLVGKPAEKPARPSESLNDVLTTTGNRKPNGGYLLKTPDWKGTGLPNVGNTCYANSVFKAMAHTMGHEICSALSSPAHLSQLQDDYKPLAGTVVSLLKYCMKKGPPLGEKDIKAFFKRLQGTPAFNKKMKMQGAEHYEFDMHEQQDAIDFMNRITRAFQLDHVIGTKCMSTVRIDSAYDDEGTLILTETTPDTFEVKAGSAEKIDYNTLLETLAPPGNPPNPRSGQFTRYALVHDAESSFVRLNIRPYRTAQAQKVALENFNCDREFSVAAVSTDGGESHVIRLRPSAVICHVGTMSGGHYYTYQKSGDGQWWLHDDKQVIQKKPPQTEQPVFIQFEVISTSRVDGQQHSRARLA